MITFQTVHVPFDMHCTHVRTDEPCELTNYDRLTLINDYK